MKNLPLFFYRGAALVAGLGWVVSIFANLVTGTTVFEFLRFVSNESFEYHPMLDYWMKMAGLAFAFIGLGFFYLAVKWKETLPLGIYFGGYQLLSGVSVLITIARLELDSQLYLLDCLFFFGTGLAMVLGWRRLKKVE